MPIISKRLLAKDLDRIYRVSPIANTALLVGNTGLAIASAMEWRGNFYFLAFLSILTVGMLVYVGAQLWAGPLDMIREARRAQEFHDPYQVYALTTFERMLWRHWMIPLLRTQSVICRSVGRDKEANELDSQIGDLERWEQMGLIPFEEFPEDLKPFYYRGGK